MVRSPSQRGSESPEAIDAAAFQFPPVFTIPEVLSNSSVLVTGGAGFIASQTLARLVLPDLALRRIFTIVRPKEGVSPGSRLPIELQPFIASRDPSTGRWNDLPIIVLAGDCSQPGFGLSAQDQADLATVEIVIHCAGDTRFSLPLEQAVRGIVGLAYSTVQFSLFSPRVRTHIHISTCFVGWYQGHGSIVRETLQQAPGPNDEQHANTYLHAKCMAEDVVNALGSSYSGRPASSIEWRIVRLSTIGPAVSFPYPGWGSGTTASPVCAAVAAEVTGKDAYHPEAQLDVVPVDVCCNQIIALTAAAHANHLSPRHPVIGESVSVYNIAGGLNPSGSIPMAILNDPRVKLAEPYIPAKNLLAAYKPMIEKAVRFDTTLARQTMGLALYSKGLPVTNGGVFGYSSDRILSEGFEVDQDQLLAKIGGWVPYLQLCRDAMERQGEPDSFEAHVD